MQYRLWAMLSVAVLSCAALTGCREADAEPTVDRGPVRLSDIFLARDAEILHTIVPPRTTLAELLARHQVLQEEAAALIANVGRHFDLRRFRAGQPYSLVRMLNGRIREFVYEIDRDRRLIARRASEDAPHFEATIAEIPKQSTIVAFDGQITPETPSLVAALDAEDGITLALALADVFSGEVAFTNDLQPGDTFRLVIESFTRDDGKFGGYGPVLAAELVNEGRPIRAIRYTPPEGKPGYYDEQGRSLKRFFLKTPLKFDPRITSGFSRSRRHPILNYRRAHNGVDYAAPAGAPVVSVASGVVTFAGWTGGGGRTVKVRHASGYESEYLHLSAIADGIRRGARVAQGEIVGRVGSTGLATGPHLHYGLKRNGQYVNPVREHLNMPPGEPVPAVHLAAFSEERDRLMGILTGDSAVRAAN